MMFPLTPADDECHTKWRTWLRYLRTLPICSPSVQHAISYAEDILQEKQ